MSLLRRLSDTNLQDGNNVGDYQTATPLTIDTSGQYSPAAILASALINGLQYEASVLAIPISELHYLDADTKEPKNLNNAEQNQPMAIPKPEQFRQLELRLDLTPMLDEDWTMGEDDELYSLPDISPQWFSPDENDTGINWDAYVEDSFTIQDDAYDDTDLSESDDDDGHFGNELITNQNVDAPFNSVSPIGINTNSYLKNNSNQSWNVEKTEGVTLKDNVMSIPNVTPIMTLKDNTSTETGTLNTLTESSNQCTMDTAKVNHETFT